MGTLDLKKLLLGSSLLLGASTFAFSPAAFAQDEDDGIAVIEEDTTVDEEDDGDTVIVTGSRVKRDTFSSISPLQVITAEASLDVGLIDPASILQESEAAAGQQIDSSFQGFVLDNGPGSETLNLRGLGAGRTLILINGRRMSPAGVEGAPTQPSINLIPGSLVDRYDILLDGASSVYGSDAVAGVTNVVLRKDFEGLELFASGDYNVAGAGNDLNVSAAWGRNTDRGFIGGGIEYDYSDEVTFGDRDFLSGCDTHVEITEDGQIRTVDLATNADTLLDTQGLIGAPTSPCKSGAGGFTARIFDRGFPAFGSAYYTPGVGNILPDFSDNLLFGVPIDRDGDGIIDIHFPDFSPGARNLEQSLLSEQKKFSAMAFGEYTFEGEMNITPYFEALYVTNDINATGGQSVVFPDVPATNPFSVCNPAATGGVDCGLAEDDLLLSPEYLAAFQAYYHNPNFDPARGIGGDDNCFGLTGALFAFCTPTTFGLLNGPLGAVPVSTQVSVRGDRNLTDVTLEQVRLVGGVSGDLPFMNNIGSLNDWSFDLSYSFSEATGKSSRAGIRDDRLALALGWDPTTDLDGDGEVDGDTINATGVLLELPGGACDTANVSNPDLLQSDAAAGCVPVNMFAPSLYSLTNGDFATQAERDYLFDTRDFDTTYTQTIFNAFATGNVFELPAGQVAGVVGLEYRVDEIKSVPDNVAAEGLFFGFFSDLGATGEKWTREAFFELDIPLLANQNLARELNTNLSARWTEDEFYGSEWTYSAKVGWRPIDPLLLKASVGTSFRAPNLRENFINGQTGFNNGLFDPCAVPADAVTINPGGGFLYDPNLDTRRNDTPQIFDNCTREGRDPTTIGFDPISGSTSQFTSAEIQTGGTDDIGPETSESFTAGFSFEQPFFDSFDLTLNVSYYDIEIENSIIEPSSQFIVNDCFLREDGSRSAFCDRLTYGGTIGTISFINAGFLNQDKDTVAGLDYNVRFNKEFTAFQRPMELGINLRANQLKERSTIFVGDDLSVSQNEFVGEFGFPEWTATNTFTLDVDDYRFTWQSRYIDSVEQDAAGIDTFSDATDSTGTGAFSDTCLGPSEGDVLCRDVGFADSWMEHAASVRYAGDTWTIRAGVNNIFDKKPPMVDSSEVFAISNTPIGNGYDLDGRQYFLTVSKDFN